MNEQPQARAQTFDRQGVALNAEWGEIYDVGRIDELYIEVATNPAQIRVSPKLANGGVDWQPPMHLSSGGVHGFSDGALSAFGLFQLRRATSGSASSVNLKAICRG